MLQRRLARILGLALLATVASQAGNAWGDHDNGNGKSQDKGKGRKNHVWCLVSDTNVLNDGDDFSEIAASESQLAGLTLAGITSLPTDFYVKEGDCAGGSPRFQISLDTDGDLDHDGNVFVYLGPAPGFTGCALQTWTSSGNLVADPDLRWDTSQVGGTFYDSHAHAVALVGSATVLDVSLVVDAGWALPAHRQVICVDDAEVNGLKLKDAFGGAQETKLK